MNPKLFNIADYEISLCLHVMLFLSDRLALNLQKFIQSFIKHFISRVFALLLGNSSVLSALSRTGGSCVTKHSSQRVSGTS